MRKADIVKNIVKQTGLEKDSVQKVVDLFMRNVENAVVEGEAVYLRGFGSFIVKHRKAKKARNISQNISIEVPAHNIPAFKPAKSFVAKLDKN